MASCTRFQTDSGAVLVDGSTALSSSGSRQMRTALPPNPASTAAAPAFDVQGVWDHLCFQ
jgi:hypothetical protein